MPRPGDIIPAWAQGLINYLSPGKPWNGFPNKLRPPQGLIDQGWEPSQRLPIPGLNWILGVFGLNLIHLDAIEAQNWGPQVQVTNLFLANQAGSAITWDPFNRRIWATADGAFAGQVWWSTNGLAWTQEAGAFTNPSQVVVNPATGMVVIAGKAPTFTAHLYARDPVTHTWATTSPANIKGFFVSKWNANQGVFMFAGWSSTNHPMAWIGAADMSTVTLTTIQGSVGYIGAIRLMAVSSAGITVATGVTAGFPSVFTDHAWKVVGDPTAQWTDLGPVSVASGGWAIYAPMGLEWDESRQVFVMVTFGGECFQSANGQDWVMMAGPAVDRLFQEYTLAVHGGVYVAVAGGTNGLTLTWSTDAGVTWNPVAYPLADPTDGPDSLVLGDDRFLLLTQSGKMVPGLRLK